MTIIRTADASAQDGASPVSLGLTTIQSATYKEAKLLAANRRVSRTDPGAYVVFNVARNGWGVVTTPDAASKIATA